MDRLAERAAEWGIDPDYVDAQGRLRKVDGDALCHIIDAVSCGAKPRPRTLLPPIAVIRRGRKADLALPDIAASSAVRWTISADGGEIACGIADSGRVALPDDLPLGVYRLAVAVGSGPGEARDETALLVAPERAHGGGAFAGGGRAWAMAVQLYGVRSRRNWGHGDFTDLAALLELAAALGAAGIGLNPLHALLADRPGQASPYSPNSRLFINPLYIDIEALAEFPGLAAAGLADEVARLRRADMVDHAGVAAAKLAGLRLAYQGFRRNADPTRTRDLEAFRREGGSDLARFASFETLRARLGGPWWEWPPDWRKPDDRSLAALRESSPDELDFHEFVQWVADRQLRACKETAGRLGLAIGLYIDVAVGVDPAGADAWSEQGTMMPGISIGAPPDPLSTAGQSWGLTTFNPRALEQQGCEPFRRMVAAAMRHAGAIRIDHVLGLNRIFLIPRGADARKGAYIRFPFEALLAVVAQESVRNRCIVIGEDLGTVPDNLRGALADWNIWSYLVMLFERAPDGFFHPPVHYAQDALVTFGTHDLATFAGWWSGHDLRTKRAIGLDPGEDDNDRDRARAALRDALTQHGLAADDDLDVLSVVRFLAAAPSRLLMVSIEDALGVADQPNVPGTVDEHPNWQRRLPVALEDLSADPRLRALGRALAAAGRSSAAVVIPGPEPSEG